MASGTAQSLGERSVTLREKRVSAVVVGACLALAFALAPWASLPTTNDPRISGVASAAICLVDLCTALLLGNAYRRNGRAALLLLTGVYVYGGLMAALHVAAFPGALWPEPLFGNAQTVAWLYVAWRGLTAAGYLATVLVEAAGGPRAPTSRRNLRLAACVLAAGAAAAGLALLASTPTPLLAIDGTRYAAVDVLLIWASVALCAAALAIIALRGAFDDALYLWLALVLGVAIFDLTLSNVAGARYTLGWALSRVAFVASSYLLLAYALGGMAPERPRGLAATLGTYGGAVGTALAAVLLRMVCDPWLGHEVPYITLFGSVALAVWLGGARAAALTFVIGYALVRLLYFSPLGHTAIARENDLLELGLIGLSCGLIIVLGEAMRRARDLYRASEVALRDRAIQLQRADANKSQFLAMLSHELRNPLAPLRNGLAILQHKPSAAAVESTLAMMERQIAQLARLIDDLLDVSRIDRGKLEFRRERVALDAVVRAAVETALPSIEAKHHALVVHYAGRPLHVDGDPVRLTQVVGNLLNNAAKFTPEGGRIELTLGTDGRNAVLSVKDNGIGIEREHLNEVFEMFVQVDATRHAAAGGLGLGLTLVRSIVAHHGGRVEARSAGAGRGTEFVVTLPLASAAAEPVAPAPLPRSDARRRILVVDDNVDAARSLAELLRLGGYAVEAAYEGESAFRTAQTLRPDVAFIDLNMPGVDGYTLARQLRATPWGRTIKLVALTGMGQKADVERTREAGFDEHLTKPADPERLARLAAGTDRDENVVRLRGNTSPS